MAFNFLKYNWPSFVWAGVIMYLCLVPSGHLPSITIPNFDKIVHFTFYFILSILTFWGWKKQTAFSGLYTNTFIKVFITACAYGFMIEIFQELFTTTRHFELLDEACNASGALAGNLLAVKMFKQ